jgi:hypothetical protein
MIELRCWIRLHRGRESFPAVFAALEKWFPRSRELFPRNPVKKSPHGPVKMVKDAEKFLLPVPALIRVELPGP